MTVITNIVKDPNRQFGDQTIVEPSVIEAFEHIREALDVANISNVDDANKNCVLSIHNDAANMTVTGELSYLNIKLTVSNSYAPESHSKQSSASVSVAGVVHYTMKIVEILHLVGDSTLQVPLDLIYKLDRDFCNALWGLRCTLKLKTWFKN